LFSEPTPGQIQVDIDYRPGLSIVRSGQPPAHLVLPRLGQPDVVRAINDLVILRTGIKTSCFLPMSTRKEKVGDHVISVGYPISAPTGALYEGFVSARYHHLPIPIAHVNGRPIMI